MNKDELITIRSMVPKDKNFILATFLRGLYYGNDFYHSIPKQTFMENYHKIIEFLINNPNNEINVACLKEDLDEIKGYSIVSKDKNTIHWVFIKKNWRNVGLARDLTPTSIKECSHFTVSGSAIMKKKNLSFNPFVI